VVSVRGAMPDGRAVSVSGSLWSNGVRDTVKLTEVDGFDLELDAEGILLFFRYVDRPGVVGRIGTALGAADVNIAGMQVSRRSVGGDALMALTVDSAINADLLQEAAAEIGATAASAVDLRRE
jgi:D-3-phosphoglycerate dehydrogenase